MGHKSALRANHPSLIGLDTTLIGLDTTLYFA